MALPLIYNLESVRVRWASTVVAVLGIAGSAEFLEPLVVLAAGSLEPAALRLGSAFARRWFSRAVEEYFERCVAAGLGDRRGRSRLTAVAASLAA